MDGRVETESKIVVKIFKSFFAFFIGDTVTRNSIIGVIIVIVIIIIIFFYFFCDCATASKSKTSSLLNFLSFFILNACNVPQQTNMETPE